MTFAADLSLDHLVIASDCKPIMDDIIKKAGGPHITVVKEIDNRRAHFTCFDFMFEGRASNDEARNFVKFSLISSHDPLCIPLNIVPNY